MYLGSSVPQTVLALWGSGGASRARGCYQVADALGNTHNHTFPLRTLTFSKKTELAFEFWGPALEHSLNPLANLHVLPSNLVNAR